MSYCREGFRLLRHAINTARRYPANPGTCLCGLVLAGMAYGQALAAKEPARNLDRLHHWWWRVTHEVSLRMDAALYEIRDLRERCGEDQFGSPFERMGERR